MKFSVVIPLYNKETEIRRTVKSVLAQSCPDFELVIVDDGSTDGGAEIVEALCADDYRIRLIRKANGGVCSARNAGIDASSGEFVALLDADDTWDPDFLLEAERMIADFPECALWGLGFAELYEGRPFRELPTGLPKGFRGIVENYFGMEGRVSDLFCSSSVIIRRTIFDRVGTFDEHLRYSEDIDMWWRIIADFPVAYYDRPMAFYHYDAGNRAMNRRIPLEASLPCYPEKFARYKGNEPFYTLSQRWCGIKLRQILFGSDKTQQDIAKEAAKKLDFSVLPIKYRLIFKTPHFIGKFIYNATCKH